MSVIKGSFYLHLSTISKYFRVNQEITYLRYQPELICHQKPFYSIFPGRLYPKHVYRHKKKTGCKNQ